MKTGLELISNERREQIEKHGRTVEWDIRENSGEDMPIIRAVNALTLPPMEFDESERFDQMPEAWNRKQCVKMVEKQYVDRLIIAGALIAAEIDRLLTIQDKALKDQIGIE